MHEGNSRNFRCRITQDLHKELEKIFPGFVFFFVMEKQIGKIFVFSHLRGAVQEQDSTRNEQGWIFLQAQNPQHDPNAASGEGGGGGGKHECFPCFYSTIMLKRLPQSFFETNSLKWEINKAGQVVFVRDEGVRTNEITLQMSLLQDCPKEEFQPSFHFYLPFHWHQQNRIF